VLERHRAAVGAGDDDALAGTYAEDCVWLTEEGVVRGRDAAIARHRVLRARWPDVQAVEWVRIQQHGAHAALGWVGRDTAGAAVARGAAVVEVRRGVIVFRADLAEDA
jgi:hypothetical protein